MNISVIIPAYNQDDLIKYHVEFCMASNRLPYEVVVVNDGGPDTLRDKLLTINKKTRLIYAKIEQDIPWNQPGARNLGVWLSTGDYLALEDADHLPHQDFYKEASQKLDEGADIVLARKRWSLYMEDLVNGSKELCGTRGTHKFVSLIKRDVWLKMKGFDERFSGHYGWDVPDWKRKVQRHGFKYDQIGYYYHIEDGSAPGKWRRVDANNKRFPEGDNYRLLKENDKYGRLQHPGGILNFNYSYEVL